MNTYSHYYSLLFIIDYQEEMIMTEHVIFQIIIELEIFCCLLNTLLLYVKYECTYMLFSFLTF